MKDGGSEAFVFYGRVLTLYRRFPRQSLHQHRPFELLLALDGPILFRSEDGTTAEVRERIVGPLEKHAVVECGGRVARAYVDPGPRKLGSWGDAGALAAPASAPIREEMSAFFESPRDLAHAKRVAALWIDSWLPFLSDCPLCDPRVATILRHLDQAAVPTADRAAVAAMIGLSPSRFAALFLRDTGVPLGRYVEWRRVLIAARLIREGQTVTFAALASGFSDGAHLSRTYRKTFGTPPSHLSTMTIAQGVSARHRDFT